MQLYKKKNDCKTSLYPPLPPVTHKILWVKEWIVWVNVLKQWMVIIDLFKGYHVAYHPFVFSEISRPSTQRLDFISYVHCYAHCENGTKSWSYNGLAFLFKILLTERLRRSSQCRKSSLCLYFSLFFFSHWE